MVGTNEVPDDLTKLRSLEPRAIEDALSVRFAEDLIYTNINTLLVALNPYKTIKGLYGERTLQEYAQYATAPKAPHVYTVAAAAYRGLLESRSQSIIVSGESGAGARHETRHGVLAVSLTGDLTAGLACAGKTETSKIVLQYLAHVATATAGRDSGTLEQRVISSSPVLEAFGNARTIMNDNSSRYGKFLSLRVRHHVVGPSADIPPPAERSQSASRGVRAVRRERQDHRRRNLHLPA